MTGGELSAEEAERLTGSLAWHFDCHAEFPTGSYKSLGIQNALLIVAQIVAARVAAAEAERAGLAAQREAGLALADEWDAIEDQVLVRRAATIRLRAALGGTA